MPRQPQPGRASGAGSAVPATARPSPRRVRTTVSRFPSRHTGVGIPIPPKAREIPGWSWLSETGILFLYAKEIPGDISETGTLVDWLVSRRSWCLDAGQDVGGGEG